MIIESGLVKAGLVKTGLVRAISNINTRYFRRNEGTTDYATIPEVTLAGSWEIEFDFLPASDSDMRIFGEVGIVDNYIRYEGASSKDIVIVGDGFSIRFSGTEIQKSVINSLSISRVGSQYSLIVNSGAAILVTGSLDSIRYDSIYAGNSFQNVSGILSNLKIWDNGTLIRDYPLDDNSDILRNRATVLGAELWNGVSDFPADTNVTAATGTTAGASYLTTISGLSGGEDFRFSGQSGFESVGNGVFVLTAPGSSMQFRSIGVSESGVAISIRKADGYGTVINGNASDWGLFQQQATGEWLGQELVVNGGFDTDSDWQLSGGWSISGGAASSMNTGGITQVSAGMGVGLYRFSVGVAAISSGAMWFQSGSAGYSGASITTSGVSVEDLSVTIGGRVSFGSNLTAIGSIDNVSVKEVLNVA